MRHKFILSIVAFSVFFIVIIFHFFLPQKAVSMHYDVQTVDDVIHLFPTTVEQLHALVQKTKERALADIQSIISIPDSQRTFQNTAYAFDRASSFYFSISSGIISTLRYLSPHDALRDAASKAAVELSTFSIDTFGQNSELYKAIKAYVEQKADKEALSDDKKYFLQETMLGFKRAGLEQPLEKREIVKDLEKKLSQLCTDFSKNINEDHSSITVSLSELKGMPEYFINALKKTNDGNYILITDYPTVFPILEYSEVAETRKKMYLAYVHRAYPANKEILEDIISTRDALAQQLGYPSYAAYNIENEMAKTPQQAREFIEGIVVKAQEKKKLEFEILKKDLPESVHLENDKFLPWDGSFCIKQYKAKHFAIDYQKLKEYFPLDQTIKGLLSIYQQFFGLIFKEVPVQGLWDPSVKMIEVWRDTTLLGFLALDLYPRENKYSHACHITVIPALKTEKNILKPSVSVVVANFTKPTPDKPSLLELSEVRTFFHEFGHAIHALLGATELASFSGTSVKTDFVEMPSQMLEEWLWDFNILKNLSGHYQTGEHLSDELVNKLIALKNFSSGGYILSQSLYSLMALDFFEAGAHKDVIGIMIRLHKRLLSHVNCYEESKWPFSWGHLTGYGAKYYSYLWSQVFAIDLFNHIKKHGLLNQQIGRLYTQKILSKGGSVDPVILLQDFLGRAPNPEAFFADLGL